MRGAGALDARRGRNGAADGDGGAAAGLRTSAPTRRDKMQLSMQFIAIRYNFKCNSNLGRCKKIFFLNLYIYTQRFILAYKKKYFLNTEIKISMPLQ